MYLKQRELTAVSYISPESSVLDIGCGDGQFMKLLELIGCNVKGVEIEKDRVAIAQQRGLDVVCSDANDYDLSQSFDWVVFNHSICYTGVDLLKNLKTKKILIYSTRDHVKGIKQALKSLGYKVSYKYASYFGRYMPYIPGSYLLCYSLMLIAEK